MMVLSDEDIRSTNTSFSSNYVSTFLVTISITICWLRCYEYSKFVMRVDQDSQWRN